MSVAEDTAGNWHARTPDPVGHGVTSTHHEVHRILPIRQRPPRCLRHRVWMASCTDCGTAHAEALKVAREAARPAR